MNLVKQDSSIHNIAQSKHAFANIIIISSVAEQRSSNVTYT